MTQATSMFPGNIKGSQVDYAEALINSYMMDASRRPYVLARIALLDDKDRLRTQQVTSHAALSALHYAQEDGVLQPPLSFVLANEIEAFLEANPGHVSEGNPAARILLAFALDEGTRPLG